ncbi:PAS domain S-box protein [Geobacter sp.]|uniref:sensor histidine kinase n=1 Tax=Geobacter sp. TaxID=46610 RepID=UPI00262FE2F9|nr:PAS domain S-box protein [Geobacter sp.]
MKLKRKTTIAISALMIAFAAFMALATGGIFERTLRETILDQQVSIVTYLADEIDHTLGTAQQLLLASADIFPVDALASPEKTRRFLQSRTSLNRLFSNQLMVIAPTGEVVATSCSVFGRRVRNNFADAEFFRETLKKGAPLISDVTSCTLDERPSQIVMTAPITDDHERLRGVLVGAISLDHRNPLSRFSAMKIGRTGYLQLVAPDRTILLHPDQDAVLRQVSPSLEACVEAALRGGTGTRRTVDGTSPPMLTTTRKLAQKEWVLAASYPEDEAYAPLHEARYVLALSTLLGVAALITLVSLSIRYLTGPLTRFTGHIRGLPGATGSDRLVTIETDDEIAELAEAFNAMVVTLDAQTESIQESEERFRSTFEQAAVGIAHVGLDGRFLRVNRRFCGILGFAEGEMDGMSFGDITSPEDWERSGACRQELLDGAPSCATENRYLRKEGTPVWVNQTASLLLDPDGNPKYFIVVIEDISVRKEAEDEIRRLNAVLEQRVLERTAQLAAVNEALRTEIGQRIEAQEEITWLNEDLQRQKEALEASNRELEAFSYSVSHDLRAPLRTIAGFSDALLEDCSERLDEAGRDYLGRIRNGAHRMGQLVDSLLSLARLGRGELRKCEVDLSRMAREIADELRRGEPQRSVELRVAERVTACGDPRLLRIVLVNLIGNAWKYTGRRREAVIEFGSAREGDSVVFFVRDNGAGFPMACAEKLFIPFQRLHRKDEYEGNGIGLATVQRIVQRHGGRIWAEGAEGAGATFYFTL